MRTTLEIDDDVIQAARGIARLKNVGLGRVVSELARRGLTPDSAPRVESEKGIPVWKHGPGAIPVTSEMVRGLAEDE